MAELMRCPIDALLDRPVLELVDPCWLDTAQSHIAMLRAGHRQRYELGLIRADGTKFVAEVNATPLRDNAGAYHGAVAVIKDVSARLEAEAEARFRTAALDGIGEAVIATRPDSTVVYANPASERLLGWRPADLIGQVGVELLPSPDASETARRVHAHLLAAKPQTGELRLTRRDGSQFPAYITGTPITDEKGELIAFVAVIRDDTERHRLEQEVRAQEQQAEIVALLGSRLLSATARDTTPILTEAVEACRRAVGADLGVLLDVTGLGEDLRVRVTSPHRPAADVIPGGSRSIAGYTALAGKVVVVDDAPSDRRFDQAPTPSWRGPIRSAVAAPVLSRTGVCGVVLVARMTPERFSPSAAHFVQSVANIVGMALQPD
jgi:PAS domain S-box-containing protein